MTNSSPSTLGGIVQTLKRARYLQRPETVAEFNRKAIRAVLKSIAARPYTGPLTGAAREMFVRDYGHKKIGPLICELSQLHMGRITPNMLIGQANRLGLLSCKARKRRLLATGL